MAEPKIYTVQPRFQVGTTQGGWMWLDNLFQMGSNIPQYGDIGRDAFLSVAWRNEPILAGVLSKWVEKVQSTGWKISGGRNSANFYARNVFHAAENGRGWSFFKGRGALEFLTQDKGDCYELGRVDLEPGAIDAWNGMLWQPGAVVTAQKEYEKKLADVTSGRIGAIQNFDTTLLIKMGWPGATWRLYPEIGRPVAIPDANMVQNVPMPDFHDRHTGEGICALSRLLDAKGLMLGYLTYLREEVGDLPPELVAIINGISQSKVEDSLKKYKITKEQRKHDYYGKIWWLGSDEAANPVSMSVQRFVQQQKSFDYLPFVEWWVKTISLNVGETVGEFWLIAHPGNTGTMYSVQQMKASGSGVGRYLQEDERQINAKILPYGTTFEYDNTDDDQDARRADILAKNVTSLKALAETMAEGGSKAVVSYDELRDRAVDWDILPPETVREDLPTIVSATLKSLYDDTQEPYVTIRWLPYSGVLKEEIVKPLLRGREATEAHYVYQVFKEWYGSAPKRLATS